MVIYYLYNVICCNEKIIHLRYFFHIGYVGTRYSGWQKLPRLTTVQQTIETTLKEVFRQPMPIVGCGRTDSQVHASQFFFHVDTNVDLNSNHLFKINKRLPIDIALYDILPMPNVAHARFDAMQRHYDYYFHTYKNPFLEPVSSLYLVNHLRLDAMKTAAERLMQYTDFVGLCKSPTKNEHTICHVSNVALYANAQENQYRFHIESNRFLGGMIRIIMHKLLEVGQGTLSVDEFEKALIDKVPATNVKQAYPQGLSLTKVIYPYLDLPARGMPQVLNNQEGWIRI